MDPEDVRWLWFACWVAADLWDDETWRLLSAKQLVLVRDAGALTAIAFALTALSSVHLVSGELDAAASLVDEIRAVSDATRIAAPPYGQLWLAALRGDEAGLFGPDRNHSRPGRCPWRRVRAGHRAREGGPSGAGSAATRRPCRCSARAASAPADLGSPPRAVAELIEAAVRCGDHDVAERALGGLAEMARATGTDWALGIEARSRALLSDGDVADGLYREAIERLGRTRLRLGLARARLLYGEWLRRERRRPDARDELRTALEMFTSMGTEAFAARAGSELLASGERVTTRTIETREELTTQEAQIARLARDGLSNAEIGQRLFISQHTVAYHLRKVFTKLGIASRDQLSRVLPDAAAAKVTA